MITRSLPGGECRICRETQSFSLVSFVSGSSAFPSSPVVPVPPAPSIPIWTPFTGCFCKSCTRTSSFPVSLQTKATPPWTQTARSKTNLERRFVIASSAPVRRLHQREQLRPLPNSPSPHVRLPFVPQPHVQATQSFPSRWL